MRSKDNLTSTAKLILKDLELGPATTQDLMHALRMQNISRAMAVLRELALIRICHWEGYRFPVWGLGPGKDARRPKKLTEKQKSSRYWQRIRENPQRLEILRTRSREWKRNNPERVKEIDKIRRQREREKRIAYGRIYREKNREEINRKERERYAAKKRLENLSKSQGQRLSPASMTLSIQTAGSAGT